MRCLKSYSPGCDAETEAETEALGRSPHRLNTKFVRLPINRLNYSAEKSDPCCLAARGQPPPSALPTVAN